MFTGIVEGIGTIRRLERVGSERDGERIDLELEIGALVEGTKLGDSVALNGCCLTVTALGPDTLTFQAVPETLRLTSLGAYGVGDRINVERALRADARLDGHIVQGHVDGTGRVKTLDRRGDDVRLEVDSVGDVGDLLVSKGAITVDGVSLTVVDPSPDGFAVALIPHTLEVTTLGARKPGDRVNLEADVLGKYVRHYVSQLAHS